MADTVLTLTQLENVFQSLIISILNATDPSVVRIGWPQDGQPGWHITDDVVFLLVNFEDSDISRQTEISYQDIDGTQAYQNQSHIRPVRVSFTLYGPNSFDNVSLIRSSLSLPSSNDTLSANNLALVPDIPMPIRAPELFNGQWWPRVSFYATFNELVVRQATVPYIQSADVQVEVNE